MLIPKLYVITSALGILNIIQIQWYMKNDNRTYKTIILSSCSIV